MGLFGKKKKEAKGDLPPLQFPELPKSVPTLESKSIGVSEEEKIKGSHKDSLPEAPTSKGVTPPMPEPSLERPLFVKIGKYKELVDTLTKLKARLNDADQILQKLNTLKESETRELNAWSRDLETIRTQLLDIDKKLFE